MSKSTTMFDMKNLKKKKDFFTLLYARGITHAKIISFILVNLKKNSRNITSGCLECAYFV